MTEVTRTLRSAHDLAHARLVSSAALPDIVRVAQKYAVAIPPQIAALIVATDQDDPIARQFVPDARELDTRKGELADPIADHPYSPVPGIVHRYQNRVLLKIVSVCPVYCRFCFRREMIGPGKGEMLTRGELEAALAYIGAHPEISEVILTGGDPFVLSPRKMREVTRELGNIPHLQRLRWHTRVPVVDPGKITEETIRALMCSGKSATVAIHTNHARELSPAARHAIATLADASINLLSQTVLLKGINDSAGILEVLLRALLDSRVKPYYLHHGDLAPGTSHFRATLEEGKAIMAALRARLPQDMLPRYMLDIPGGFGKVNVETAVTSLGAGRYSVRDSSGREHLYEDT